MKKILTIMTFMILITSSYSEVLVDNDIITIQNDNTKEGFIISIPKDENTLLEEDIVVTFEDASTDIYPTKDKLSLSNNRDEEITLKIDKDILWIQEDGKVAIIIKDQDDKIKLKDFFSKSEEVDFQFYKTNVLYEINGVQMDDFKELYHKI